MKLVVDIHNKIVKIILLEDKKEQDYLEFSEENNLSDKLLSSVDELLQKNKLSAKDVEKMELETDLTDGFTTYRIAKAVVDSFNWGKGLLEENQEKKGN